MTERERIGKRIAELRKQKGWTAQQLADATGILQTNIIRIEQGKHSTGIDILAKISNALGCEIEIKQK